LLPIRASNPPSFPNVHTSPADAIRAFLDLNSRWMVPMHYGSFRLSHEPMDEPLRLLGKEAKAAGVEERVLGGEEGVTRFFGGQAGGCGAGGASPAHFWPRGRGARNHTSYINTPA